MTRCKNCYTELVYAGRGRRPMYCTPKCRREYIASLKRSAAACGAEPASPSTVDPIVIPGSKLIAGPKGPLP